jgi:hypothetical protein
LAVASGVETAAAAFCPTGSVRRCPGCADSSTHATLAPLPLNATSVAAPWSACSDPLLTLSSEPPLPVADDT